MLKKIFTYTIFLIGAVLLFAAGYIGMNYKKDIPVETLVDKYATDDSKFVTVDGLNVHYQQVGNGHPLVLLHGFGAHLWNWKRWTNLLKDDYQIISLDLPGFGLTGPRTDGDYSTESQVRFLNKFIAKIGVDSFYLGGNSMGGGIAWQYALAHPQQVKKLILLNSSGYPRATQDDKTPQGFQLLKMPLIKNLVTKITPRSILKKTVEEVYVDKSFATEEEVDLYMNMMLRTGNRQVLVDKMNNWEPPQFQKIKNIKTPTLILWGDQDVLIDYQNAYKFEKDIEGAKAIVYENVGHLPMDEVAEQSVKDLRAFLK